METKKCCDCGQHIDKQDMVCPQCNAEQLMQKGMFGWSCLGFLGGWVIPGLAVILLTILLTDKHVVEHFLNVTLLNRSRWQAARKGMVVGYVLKVVIYILLICSIVGVLNWIATGLYS